MRRKKHTTHKPIKPAATTISDGRRQKPNHHLSHRSRTSRNVIQHAASSITASTAMPKYAQQNLVKLCVVFLFGALVTLTNVCRAKPTIMFSLPPSLTSSLPSLSSYTRQFGGGGGGGDASTKPADLMKTYSGVRRSNDSLIMIYHHDQTIAVVELGQAKLLLGCEIIEIYDDDEGRKFLHQLSAINRPLEISFKEMIQLMGQCQYVDAQHQQSAKTEAAGVEAKTSSEPSTVANVLPLLKGIIPGTKWCGTGDIASTYADLGTETSMDRCCRSHDLCPVKVRANMKRYNLLNNSYYSKSHCVCDDMLFSCLKKANTSAAQVLGSIYFNLAQVPCLQQTPSGMMYRRAREGF